MSSRETREAFISKKQDDLVIYVTNEFLYNLKQEDRYGHFTFSGQMRFLGYPIYSVNGSFHPDYCVHREVK